MAARTSGVKTKENNRCVVHHDGVGGEPGTNRTHIHIPLDLKWGSALGYIWHRPSLGIKGNKIYQKGG